MAEAQDERRREARFRVLPPLECLVRGKGYGETTPGLEGKLRNLSAGGALFDLGKRMPPGAMVVLSVKNKAGSFEVEGEVLWVTQGAGTSEGPSYVHGLQFPAAAGGPDPAIEKLLHRYATARGGEGDPAGGA